MQFKVGSFLRVKRTVPVFSNPTAASSTSSVSPPIHDATLGFRWLAPILAFIALTQIFCIRPGHIWGDDFALYILQAKHILSGGFVAHEFIPNPKVLIGGQTYPPALSVLLVPVYAVLGINLTAMKILLIVIFTAGLVFLYLLFDDRLPTKWLYTAVVIVGLDPFIFRMRDEIETEKPFLTLALLTLWLIKRAYGEQSTRSFRLAVAIGLSIFGACATRNVGLAFFPVLPVLDLLRFRKITGFTVVALAVAGVPTLLMSLFLGSTSGYGEYFIFSPLWILHSAFIFGKVFEQFWWGLHPRWIGFAVLGIVSLFAARGLYLSIKRSIGPVELFIVFYLAIILPYYASGYALYLVPLFPFLVTYALIGLHNFATTTRHYRQTIAAAAVVITVLFGTVYARASWGRIPDGIGDPQFIAVCDYIKHQTPKSEIVVFRKPRLLALLTEHPATVYPMHLNRGPDVGEVWDYLRTVRAGYVVIAHLSDPEFEYDGTIESMLARVPALAQPAYSNASFVIYRLRFKSSEVVLPPQNTSSKPN